MIITFGLQLDDRHFPNESTTNGGTHYVGPQGILRFFETHFGLNTPLNNVEHLRIEAFRQALSQYLELHDAAFFTQSYEADQLATAVNLLEARDELLLAGWDFVSQEDTPERLKTLGEIEQTFRRTDHPLFLPAGFADRFEQVLSKIGLLKHPLQKIRLQEPPALLTAPCLRLINALQADGVTIELIQVDTPKSKNDLGHFQQLLSAPQGQGLSLKADGSLLLLRSKRETDAARYVANLIKKNPQYKPLCLVPEKNRALDNALIQEGQPSLGILLASLARPSLQILKLVTSFFWRPIDPYKIMEFVSLQVKPLDDRLASILANRIAQTPGIKGEGWYIAINRFFDELKERAQRDSTINLSKVRDQYDFWFERKRYDISQQVPKTEVIEVFDYLAKWASDCFEENNSTNSSLIVLSEQAKRVKDLVEALPVWQAQLTFLELERIVRTIYEPSPVQFRPKEIGQLDCVHTAGAITAATDKLLWWNFTSNERDYFFSRWYKNELAWLHQNDVPIQGPKEDNARLLWHRSLPVLRARQQLLLIQPQNIDGSEVFPHPLHDELEAAFGDLRSIVFDIDTSEGRAQLARQFDLPQKEKLDWYQLGRPQPFLHIQNPRQLQKNEQESFSSLNALFYYPYQWAFRYKVKLRKSSILSVVKDVTLMGNLSHRFLELIFKEQVEKWTKEEVETWIDKQSNRLLAREGAVLLMYGREPERIAFINKIKYAAWSLISMIQQNGWKVKATEMDLAGSFLDRPIRAKADLVLEKEGQLAVVDLKWRGARRRQENIENEEDLQLVMYARLLTTDKKWAHTSYFILENGKMIARNNLAFKEALAVSPDLDHETINQRILDKMAATYEWRMNQLKEGLIEVRTQQTKEEIDETYGAELMELLEMQTGDAPFDDYRTLINLID